MRVILLGSNGQLGSDIIRENNKSKSNIDIIGLQRRDVDITDTTKLREVLDTVSFDAIINCTSYHKTDEVEDNASLAFKINAEAVKSMAAACERKQARFIHISTDYVFGGRKHNTPITENMNASPLNVYGASKYLGETLASLECTSTTIVRVASLFGVSGASGKGGNFVETMINLAKERGTLQVVDDQVMSPTYTKDVARGLLELAVRNSFGPEVYHLVNSGSASWYEFARSIISEVGIDANILPCSSTEFSTRALRPSYSVLSNKKFTESIIPMRNWRDALKDYLVCKGYSPETE